MSVEIPIQNNGMMISEMGPEFYKVQNVDRDRGLITPINRDNAYSDTNITTKMYLGGIENQNLLYANNYDSSEEQKMTDPQALDYILNQNTLKRNMTAEEKQLNMWQDHDLDPRIRHALYEESVKAGTNIFNQQSQDFVKEIQDSVKSYNDEQNLYISAVPFTQSRSSILGPKRPEDVVTTDSSLVKNALDIIDNLTDENKKKFKERIEKRKRFIPASEPTQEERLQARREGKTATQVKKEKFEQEHGEPRTKYFFQSLFGL